MYQGMHSWRHLSQQLRCLGRKLAAAAAVTPIQTITGQLVKSRAHHMVPDVSHTRAASPATQEDDGAVAKRAVEVRKQSQNPSIPKRKVICCKGT